LYRLLDSLEIEDAVEELALFATGATNRDPRDEDEGALAFLASLGAFTELVPTTVATGTANGIITGTATGTSEPEAIGAADPLGNELAGAVV